MRAAGAGEWRGRRGGILVRRATRIASRARQAAFTALGLGFATLCLGLLLLLVAPRATLAAPSQSLAQSARQVQLHPAHLALTPSAPAQPTQIDLSQPTVGASSTPVAAPASTSLGSNGLTIAVILSCLTGIFGLILGSVALSALLRRGYGPFLRTLLPGGRRASRGSSRTQRRGSNGYDRSPAPRRPAPTRRR